MRGLWEEWCATDEAVQDLSRHLENLAMQDERGRRLMTGPGGSARGATAMVAAIAYGSAFSRGRDFATWPGLVPQRMSTGGKTRLGESLSAGPPI